MAKLLYRLGRFSAKRAWTVLVTWLVLLAIAGGGFAIGFKGLVDSFDIPDTDSGDIVAELEEKLPDFSGASGSVVFHTENGEAFTDEQTEAIGTLVGGLEDLPNVASAVEPFSTEAMRATQAEQMESGASQIEEGQAELTAARDQLDEGQAQLDAGRDQLDEAQAELDTQLEQAQAAGYPTDQLEAGQAQLDEQYGELDAQQEQIDSGLAEIEGGQEQIDAQTHQLDVGQDLLGMADEYSLVSEDGSAAIASVSFDEQLMDLPQESKQGLVDYLSDNAVDGVKADVSNEIVQTIPEIFGINEVLGVLVAGLVLIVVLGSWLAATFPIVTAVTGVGIATLASLAFSGTIQMTSVTPVFGVMLGLAVGIDYSLFILNRHRRQLMAGKEVHDSIGLANGTAGTAVVFAASTVVVALLALNVTGIPFLGLMGTVGAVSVAIAALLAVTATPALLGLAGERMLGKKARAKLEARRDGTGKPRKNSPARAMKTWKSVVRTIVGVVVLGVIAIPALSMRLGLPAGDAQPEDSTAYQAYETIEQEFGAGANSMLIATADLPAGMDEGETLDAQLDIASALYDQDGVVAVAPIAVSDDGELAAFQVVPTGGPNDASTTDLVHQLRDLPAVDGQYELGVAGQAAVNIDISQGLNDALPLYLAVVVGISLIIMIVVFRSLLVPLVATLGFVLSLFATYGVVTAVFQWGWLSTIFAVTNPAPLLAFLPIILVGILFGLAMDYQLFLATGMREAYVEGAPARVAVSQGYRSGRRVVTAAALIMISVFARFVASVASMIKSIGLGLAVGVLLDAFVVRMWIMPAVMTLLGESAWWLPKWLDRILPRVDVEGSQLEGNDLSDTLNT
ncbi:MMPL family transporter [Ancrocorticia sp.]|uniref:MMPL family transporter n=1 Tax=Ancrocorticia sp. TaxID=2593684 RepID=UPI003F939DBF